MEDQTVNLLCSCLREMKIDDVCNGCSNELREKLVQIAVYCLYINGLDVGLGFSLVDKKVTSSLLRRIISQFNLGYERVDFSSEVNGFRPSRRTKIIVEKTVRFMGVNGDLEEVRLKELIDKLELVVILYYLIEYEGSGFVRYRDDFPTRRRIESLFNEYIPPEDFPGAYAKAHNYLLGV